jgi:hypothetical protein
MTTTNPVRRWLVTAAVAGGVMLGAAGIAGAATSTSTNAVSGASMAAGANPATVTHGPGETLLAGTTAVKVKAAALATVPGGTIVRVETDSAGSAYEAHVKKADGTFVTVKINSSFTVTATQPGFGSGPAGAPAAPGA